MMPFGKMTRRTRMSKGIFVVIEGVDRCGKTTLSKLLAENLAAQGRDFDLFSTPDYGGFAGKEIGDHLRGKHVLDALDFECMLIANRYEVAGRVRDALAMGRAAICVRWWQSALLYGHASGHDADVVRRTCSSLPEPDLNILVDVNPLEIAERYDRQNIYEQDLGVQVRLAHAYRKLWEVNVGGDRWSVVDGAKDPAALAWQILALALRRL
jgi:dTMP kinase